MYRLTRIAPTPSGFLHLGNALSFFITTELARRNGAKVMLRIDDLDQERARPDFVDDVFRVLAFLGINWQTGPRNPEEFRARWSQTHRMQLYTAMLQKLKGAGLVFACACSRTTPVPCSCRERRLPIDAPDLAWRLDTGKSQQVMLRGVDGKSTRYELPPEMTDFIVRRRNGIPSYQLASATDDLHFGVDLIVRGDDLLPSSIAQALLMRMLDEASFGEISFFHHRLITDASDRKLSKSAGDISVKHFMENGRSPEDVVAAIASFMGIPRARNVKDIFAQAGLPA
jgi:glutamyl/glutaminyl-tRNA synthetase